MGKFRCVCGEVLSTSGESSDEWLMIESKKFGALWDAEEGFEEVFQKMRRMYLCPASGHVWIFWAGLGEPGTCYYPGSSDPKP